MQKTSNHEIELERSDRVSNKTVSIEWKWKYSRNDCIEYIYLNAWSIGANKANRETDRQKSSNTAYTPSNIFFIAIST